MNTDADVASNRRMTARLRINLKPKKGPRHVYASPEYGAPPMPVCAMMRVNPFIARADSVECRDCAVRVPRQAPWDAYRLRGTERFIGYALRIVNNMALVIGYGDSEPEAVWDIKTRKRLK